MLVSAVAWVVFCLSAEVIIFLALRHTEISINNKYKNYRDIITADHGFKGKKNAPYFILSRHSLILNIENS